MDAPRLPSTEDLRIGSAHAGPITVRSELMARLGVAARVARAAAAGTVSDGAIRTPRLILRPLREADRPEFLRVLRLSRDSLDALCPLGTDAKTDDDDVFERQLALSDGAVRTGRAIRLIAVSDDGRIVGGFNINDIIRGLENSGEMVLWTSADARRTGYAEEAARALLAHAFADMPAGLGLHRVHGYIAPANERCHRLARRLGLRMCVTTPSIELRIGDRLVRHEPFEIFASVEAMQERAAMPHVVEGKPSIAEDLFGRGLLSILRTEGAAKEP